MDENAGAVVTPTKTTEEAAPLIPGRGEVLKEFASGVLKSFADLPEPTAGDAQPGDQNPPATEAGKPNVLSQTDEVKVPETEPQWNAEQQAWFDQMASATTDEERAALQQQQPAFSPEEIAWLQADAQRTSEGVQPEDHLAEDAELKGKLDAVTQERINKRIGKEVAKTKAAQEEAETLKSKITELEGQLANRPVATGGGKSSIETVQQLRVAESNAMSALDQAEELLAQVEDDPAAVEQQLRAAKVALKGADGTEDYSPAKMRQWLNGVKRQANHALRVELPQRAEFLKQVDASAGKAFEILPQLKDAKSEQRKLFEQTVAQFPGVKQFPNWPSALALMIVGQQTVAKLQAATQAPARKARPIPVVIPSPRGAAPTVMPKPKSSAVTEDTVNQALNGNKKARLRLMQTLVPK